MSEPQSGAPETPSSATASTAPSAGALLRAARERAGLPVDEFAAQLKVTARRVELIETDQFDQLPDAVFVRALAQTMCRALKIDPAPVLALLPQASTQRLDKVHVGLNAPFREGPTQILPDDWTGRLLPFLGGAGLLVAGVLMFYFLPSNWGTPPKVSPRTVTPTPAPAEAPAPALAQAPATNPTPAPAQAPPQAPPQTQAAAPAPAPAPPQAAPTLPVDTVPQRSAQAPAAAAPAPGAVERASPTPLESARPAPAAVAPAPAAAPAPQAIAAPAATAPPAPTATAPAPRPTPAPAPAAATPDPAAAKVVAKTPTAPAPAGLLQLRTLEAAWVQVQDAQGTLLLARELRAGEAVGINGATPFKVTLGNVKATQIAFRGKAMDLRSFTRDNVARIELQ